MEILNTLNRIASKKKLSFILIGGHAVNARGFGHTTKDLDIVVGESLRSEWKDILLDLKYKLFHEQDSFMQFSVPELGFWPVDIMVVDDGTYKRLLESSDLIRIGKAEVPVAAIDHLIAMKLHALKEGPSHRRLRDLVDLKELLNLANLSDEEFMQLCSNYDTLDVYEEIK